MTQSDHYAEADMVLAVAEKMFKANSKSVTGHEWDFKEAGEQVRAIWIIKAVRSLGETKRREP